MPIAIRPPTVKEIDHVLPLAEFNLRAFQVLAVVCFSPPLRGELKVVPGGVQHGSILSFFL